MNMHCPKCGNKKTFSTERRPNGNSECLACGFKSPTAKFQVEVRPMPSPSEDPKAYMTALAEKIKAEGDRKMTQGECKNLELAESILREKDGVKAEPSPYDSMTRIELVKQCESLEYNQIQDHEEREEKAKKFRKAAAVHGFVGGLTLFNDIMGGVDSIYDTGDHDAVIEKKFAAMADGAETAWGIIANASDWQIHANLVDELRGKEHQQACHLRVGVPLFVGGTSSIIRCSICSSSRRVSSNRPMR